MGFLTSVFHRYPLVERPWTRFWGWLSTTRNVIKVGTSSISIPGTAGTEALEATAGSRAGFRNVVLWRRLLVGANIGSVENGRLGRE
ncbi:MAG TPA: hypothetical protein VLH56_06610 [Dissulfurispiraceae bacterium]|nr:hypothetical protein [Dissulfurispiraceae bacterium]